MWFVKTTRSGKRDENGELPPDVWTEGVVCPTLNVFDNSGDTRATVLIIDGTRSGNVPAVFPIQSTVIGRADTSGPQGKGYADDGEPMFTVDTVGSHAVATTETPTVRRLTPTECERLQGFPDDWTAQRYDYKKQQVIEQADSSRYKQMGNAVAVPVVTWIVERLLKADVDD